MQANMGEGFWCQSIRLGGIVEGLFSARYQQVETHAKDADTKQKDTLIE